MVEEVKPSIDELLMKAQKGAGAQGSQEYLGDLLWARLWRAVRGLCKCEPKLEALLQYRAEINQALLLAQELRLNKFEAEKAIEILKQEYK